MARYNQNIRNNLNKIAKKIMEKMMENQDIVKLLANPSHPDPLNQSLPKDPFAIINKYVLNEQKFDETISEECMMIVIEFQQKQSSSRFFRDVDITFQVIGHNNTLNSLRNGDNRLLLLIDKLDEMIINTQSEEWLGKLKYIGEYKVNINNNFVSRRLVYRIGQFS